MTDRRAEALIITDGGLTSVLAAAMEAERELRDDGGGAALLPLTSDKAKLEAIASQSRFFSMRAVEPVIAETKRHETPGLQDTQRLVTALYTALAAGIRRIVWPVHYHHDEESIGRDISRLAAAADRAILIGRLALLDAPDEAGESLSIETPFLDLTDIQVADLVVDLDAPVYLSWWWRESGAQERAAWVPALSDAGWVESGPRVETAAEAARTSGGAERST